MKKFFKKKLIYSIISIVLILNLFSVSAFAATKTLSVPRQTQAGSYSCWASCASMVSAYFNGDSRNTELSIIMYVKGPYDPNQPGSAGDVYDIKDGVKHISGVNGSAQLNFLTWNAVQHQINNNGPIAAALDTGSIGHGIVITGYETGTPNYMYYNDPANGRSYKATNETIYLTYGWANSAFWK